jgi:hypothetical protein
MLRKRVGAALLKLKADGWVEEIPQPRGYRD